MNMDVIKTGVMGGKAKDGTVWDEKGKGEIVKIFVTSGIDSDFVLSLQFLFVDHNGQFILSDTHGAHYKFSLNTTFNTVVLDYPSEFLIEIKGTNHTNGLRSITFVTNKDTYGPYGSVTSMVVDRDFNSQIGNDRSFGGFHGLKQKNYIESIGLYLKPITPSMIKPTPLTRPKRRKTN